MTTEVSENKDFRGLGMQMIARLARGGAGAQLLVFVLCLPVTILAIGLVNWLFTASLESSFEPNDDFSSYQVYLKDPLTVKCESHRGDSFLPDRIESIEKSDACFFFRPAQDMPIMAIEFRGEFGKAQPFCLTATVALRKGRDWHALKWWQDLNRRDNRIACITGTAFLANRRVEYYTNPVNLGDWLAEDYAKSVNRLEDGDSPVLLEDSWAIDTEAAEAIRPYFDKAFGENYDRIFTGFPVVVTRVINTIFPVLIFSVALLVLVNVYARRRVYIDAPLDILERWASEWKQADYNDPLTEDDIRSQRALLSNQRQQFLETWGCQSLVVGFRMSLLDLIEEDSKDLGERIRKLAKRAIVERRSSSKMLDRLLKALPSLGMLGTVIGIGYVFFGAADIVGGSDQSSAVIKLFIELAFAFDTTLLGLLLFLVVGFVAGSQLDNEEELFTRARDFLIENYHLGSNAEESADSGATVYPSQRGFFAFLLSKLGINKREKDKHNGSNGL